MATARKPASREPRSKGKSRNEDLTEAIVAATENRGIWYDTPAWGKPTGQGNYPGIYSNVYAQLARHLGCEVLIQDDIVYIRVPK